jgi:ABC-2 type transport system ATP-binding protein
MDLAIDVEELAKVYRGGVQALDGVTFAVERGEIFGYLGRNGAGKTTTVRVLATLTRKSFGRAIVDGIDIEADPAGVRRRLGVAMQDAALDDLMSAREHLTLVGRLAGLGAAEAHARAAELLDAFGLSDAADRLVATYSGGMRRRLDVAMALVHRPPILFLDEPTTGLDPQSRRAVWSMIRDLRAGGTTILLTTQYLEEADELADRVAIVDAGRIAAIGTPSELKARVGRTALGFRLDGRRALTALRKAVGKTAAVSVDGERVRLELSGNGEALLEMLGRLRARGIPIEGLSVSEPSLEDVFVRLTGEHLDGTAGSDARVGVSAANRLRGGGGRRT